MTTEERNQKMEAAGIQDGSPAAKRFKADNPVTDEAIKENHNPKVKTIHSTDNEKLLNESIKQTKHLENISNILTFFLILGIISTVVTLFSFLKMPTLN